MGEYEEYHQRSRGERSPDGIANKIIFTRKYPKNESIAFLIVEGENDRKFYRRFIDQVKCHIYSAFNKSNALQVASILEKERFPGFLAIVDADFDMLEENVPTGQNVLLTDAHDLEAMVLQSSALEKVLGEFGSEEKISQITQETGKDIRALLLECGVPIGYLRWVSLRERLSLVFENLSFNKFIHKDSFAIDQHKLIKTVINKSQQLDIAEAKIMISMQNLRNDAHDIWHVCCGHDLVAILAEGLHRVISRGKNDTRDANPDMLEMCLRLAFERTYFNKTLLYASIQRWEIANEPYTVLAQE